MGLFNYRVNNLYLVSTDFTKLEKLHFPVALKTLWGFDGDLSLVLAWFCRTLVWAALPYRVVEME